MQFVGAKVTEQRVTFGIVIVKPYVLRSSSDQLGARRLGTQAFGPIPVILMAQDGRGTPTYQGRRDIVNFLSHIAFQRIPWKKYTLSTV